MFSEIASEWSAREKLCIWYIAGARDERWRKEKFDSSLGAHDILIFTNVSNSSLSVPRQLSYKWSYCVTLCVFLHWIARVCYNDVRPPLQTSLWGLENRGEVITHRGNCPSLDKLFDIRRNETAFCHSSSATDILNYLWWAWINVH